MSSTFSFCRSTRCPDPVTSFPIANHRIQGHRCSLLRAAVNLVGSCPNHLLVHGPGIVPQPGRGVRDRVADLLPSPSAVGPCVERASEHRHRLSTGHVLFPRTCPEDRIVDLSLHRVSLFRTALWQFHVGRAWRVAAGHLAGIFHARSLHHHPDPLPG